MNSNFICINNIYILFDELVEVTLHPDDCSMEIMYYKEDEDKIESERFYFESTAHLRREYNMVINYWKGINVIF